MASVAQDHTIYVGGIGFLARLNASTGKFIWRRTGLYEVDKAFNIFGVPKEDDKVVTFEATAGIPSTPDKDISLDRRTGKILAISVAKVQERSNIGLQRTRGSCASPGR